MRILRGLEGFRQLTPGAVVSIGNFDGVHRGHQEILRRARELSKGMGGKLVVVTFEPHPLTVLKPEAAPARLTMIEQKQALLEAWGVEELVILPPEPAVLEMEAERFWELLRDEARPSYLVEGASFNFGKGRRGNIETLRAWSGGSAVKVEVVEPVSVVLVDLTMAPVSSSLVRFLVGNGRMRDAGIALGRPYVLEGEVIKGHQRGRTIGVPTANIQCRQLVPMDGVYAGRVVVDGAAYPAAVSVGTMPTFGENQRQVEAHLIGFEGDLYGRTLSVEMLDWVREQRKFHGVDALKGQMGRDMAVVMERAGMLRSFASVKSV